MKGGVSADSWHVLPSCPFPTPPIVKTSTERVLHPVHDAVGESTRHPVDMVQWGQRGDDGLKRGRWLGEGPEVQATAPQGPPSKTPLSAAVPKPGRAGNAPLSRACQ